MEALFQVQDCIVLKRVFIQENFFKEMTLPKNILVKEQMSPVVNKRLKKNHQKLSLKFGASRRVLDSKDVEYVFGLLQTN